MTSVLRSRSFWHDGGRVRAFHFLLVAATASLAASVYFFLTAQQPKDYFAATGVGIFGLFVTVIVVGGAFAQEQPSSGLSDEDERERT